MLSRWYSIGIVFRETSITTFGELALFTKIISLEAYAFYNCTSLLSIIVPANVTVLQTRAFMSDNNVELTFLRTTPPELKANALPGGSKPIYVPASAVDTYKSTWTAYASRIQAIPQ